MIENFNINRLLEIGIALSKEKDDDALLEDIVIGAMDITNCDGGTLYIKAEDHLDFRIMITRSMGIRRGGKKGPVGMPPVMLSRENVCACAVLEGRLINIPDMYGDSRFDFSGPRRYDEINGYRTVSQMVVPMEDDYGEIIGVLQLINAQDEAGNIIPFDDAYEQVVLSLASQAAICLTNMNLSAEIIGLLDSFVKVMSTAIDAMSPYNANHTRNMVCYGERFLKWLDSADYGWQMNEMEQKQLLMSIWLHDIGKLVVPLEVMDKETRLGGRLQTVLHRFEVAALTNRIAYLEGEIPESVFRERQAFLADSQELVLRVNGAGFVPEADFEGILAISQEEYRDARGEHRFFLDAGDVKSLTVRQGTLTADERRIMEGHVEMTRRMLDEMAFSRNYQKVPEWAASHHELLNGSGYPDGLKGEAIPRQVRLITIIDVFDALTAQDRPYKAGMPAERAFAIMESMVSEGKLDGELLTLFKQSNAYKNS